MAAISFLTASFTLATLFSMRPCAQALPLLRGAPPAALEAAADAFQRQAVACGEVLALAGRPLDKARP